MCEAIEKILADKKAEGLAEGKTKNQEETARKMAQDVRFSEDDILYFTGISKNDILV